MRKQPLALDFHPESEEMGFEIDFLAVGDGEKSGDAIAVRWGNLTGPRREQFVMTIDGGTLESGAALVDHVKNVYGTTVVDLSVGSHPDGDHASGQYVVLDELGVGHLWMHRPWEHSSAIKHMFADGTLSNDRLSEGMKKALTAAWDLEKLAKRKGIPITEPFSDGEAKGQYEGIYVLGPSVKYYQSLLPRFDDMPDLKEAGGGAFAAMLSAMGKSAVAFAERVKEWWNVETLRDPAEDATSPENNSTTILLLRLYGQDLLFSGDAGVPALWRAANLAGTWGIDLRACRFQQMPHHGSRRNVGPTLLDRIVGPKLPSPSPSTMTVFVSAARQGEPKHPAKKVVNAYIRRGAKVLATQGVSIRHSFDAPPRKGWGPATPLSFSQEVDEEED